MFENTNDGLIYKSKKSGIRYDILVGMTDNDKSSDIVFIFRYGTPKEQEKNNFYGELVNWTFGGFDNLDYVEELILNYEKKFNNNLWGTSKNLIDHFIGEIREELKSDHDKQIKCQNLRDFGEILGELQKYKDDTILIIKEDINGYKVELKEDQE